MRGKIRKIHPAGGLLLVSFLSVICSVSPIDVQAEPTEKLPIITDESGTPMDIGVILEADDDSGHSAYVYTAYVDTYSAETYAAYNNFELHFQAGIDEAFCLWSIDDPAILSDPAYMKKANSEQNDPVTAVYYNSDLTICTEDTTAIEAYEYYDKADNYGEIDIKALAGGFGYYPGTLLNEQEECVGLLYNEEEAYTEWFDYEKFYPTPEPTIEPTQPPVTPTPAPTETPDNHFWRNIKYRVIGWGAGIVFAVIIILLIKKIKNKTGKKKKTKAEKDSLISEAESRTSETPVPNNQENVSSETAVIDDSESEESTTLDEEETTLQKESIVQTKEYWLRGLTGIMEERVFPLGALPVTIGRDGENTVHYPPETKGVSRKHARVYLQNDRIYIENLSSLGTTLNNGEELEKEQTAELHPGDRFYISKSNSFMVMIHTE